MANLKPSEQLHFVGLLCCMGNGDGEGAADHVLNFSAMQTCTEPAAVAAFKTAMTRFFAEHCRGYYTGIDLAEVLRGVLSLVSTCFIFQSQMRSCTYRNLILSCCACVYSKTCQLIHTRARFPLAVCSFLDLLDTTHLSYVSCDDKLFTLHALRCECTGCALT